MKRWKEEFNKEFKLDETDMSRGLGEFFYEKGLTKAIEVLEERLKDEHRKVDKDGI